MLLLAVTLGLSYAVVRSQSTALTIQHNARLQASARQAALTGLTVALKKMHSAAWCSGDGVNSTVSGAISDYESYAVTYATGDDSLDPHDPANAMEFACRVTLLSTGTAVDPSDPARTATHRARAVVRLVPRALDTDDEPDEWQEMTDQHTVYQWRNGDFEVNVPFRIEGAVRIQGKLDLAKARWHYPWYPWSTEAREDYLTDLNAMRLDGLADFRPFTGPIELPFPSQEAGLTGLLESMDTNPTDAGKSNVNNWHFPAQLSTYRVYPGGKEYTVEALGYWQQDVTWKPNAETNPLGIYYRSGTLRLYQNVTIEGTVITTGTWAGNVYLHGTNVHLKPLDLPSLYGSDRPIRLPVAVVEDDFRIYAGAQGSVAGLVTVGDEFEICDAGQHDIDVPFQGPIVAKEVLIRPRSEWYQGKGPIWWYTQYQAFLNQNPEGQEGEQEPAGTPYFPVWLNDHHGLDSNPGLLIQREPRDAGAPEPRYHWKKQYDAIYVPHEEDDGLRWEVFEWTDKA